jgi:hypothetical protein
LYPSGVAADFGLNCMNVKLIWIGRFWESGYREERGFQSR